MLGVMSTLGRPEIPEHVRRQSTRRIAPTSEINDPRAGILFGVLLNLRSRGRGNIFRQNMVGQFFGHRDGLRHGVPGGLEDLVQDGGESIGPRRIVARRRRTGGFDLALPSVGGDPLDAVLYLACPGLPLGKLDTAQRGQAAVQFFTLSPHFLHFLGQPGRIAALILGQPAASQLFQPRLSRRLLEIAILDRHGRHLPVAGQHAAVAGQNPTPRRRHRFFATVRRKASWRNVAPWLISNCTAGPRRRSRATRTPPGSSAGGDGDRPPRARPCVRGSVLANR